MYPALANSLPLKHPFPVMFSQFFELLMLRGYCTIQPITAKQVVWYGFSSFGGLSLTLIMFIQSICNVRIYQFFIAHFNLIVSILINNK